MPGTGKTFAAGALARHLDKDLLVTDISRVLDKYVGESEKRLRSIFIRYGEIVKQLKNPPILLLNEADQFLGKRMQVTRSVDRMYNQMQNILLEAMENFKGMMILTTNLVEHFDRAFSRRLDLKIRFDRPGIFERQQLWKLYLKDEIPGFEKINVKSLATQYELTGGQIRMVIENACTEAATRPRNKRFLKTKDLEKYITLELSGQFETEKKKAQIGFMKGVG
jgi:SpoVK/Ycf46/Vps4 family AAA+-type ATPase